MYENKTCMGDVDMIRTVRLGAAARRRIKAGGSLAKGRPSLPLVEWNALKARVFLRAGWRCEHCHRKLHLDPNHVVKRSQGGADTDDGVVALCRSCHDLTDWPYARGRLIVTPLGGGRFRFHTVTKASKWAEE